MDQPERLIVIAGPSAVGKSVLMDAMQGARPDSATGVGLLEMNGPSDWRYLRACDFERKSYAPGDREVVHYDLCRKRRHKEDLTSKSVLAKRMQGAGDLVIVTLWEEPKTMARRVWLRTLRGGPDTGGKKTRRKRNIHRYRNLGKLYMYGVHPGRLWLRYYTEWLRFCARFEARQHWVVRTTLPDQWLPLDRLETSVPFWKQVTPTS